MMQSDDNVSAEFLFGKLASDYFSVQNPPKINIQMNSGYNKRFNFGLILFLMLEILLGLAIVYSFLMIERLLYFVIFSFSIRIIISAQKNKSLADRFAPDLVQYNSTKFSFALVQLLLSGIVFAGFGIAIFTFTDLIPDINVLDRSRIVLFVLVLFYINFISDLSIAALGKGVGVFGQSHKFSTLLGNIRDLAKIKGRQSIPLAMLRLLNWAVIYYLIINESLISLFFPYAVFSVFYLYKWEKINSSSLFMEIRGEITNGKPALLPHKIFSEDHRYDESTDQVSNNYLLNFINRESNGSMRKRSRKSKIGNLNNLAPIAARSISRIADSIKHEEIDLPTNMRDYCPNCNMEVIKATNYCAHCGERI
ncbi:MAG: zinc ribbon domain-containing protein [Candidatus Heimdallarchaeota archaeon]|nr:zinc ribbon domain-containing protein [Candidatus Heimdallarchaeota archaeon]